MELQKYTYNRVTYYVDYRLSQFRSITPEIRFIEFSDELGDRILCKLIRDGKVDWAKLHI